MEETKEARKKFSNAKSISSAQYFGDQNKSAESEAKASLQKFSVRRLITQVLLGLIWFDCVKLNELKGGICVWNAEFFSDLERGSVRTGRG